MVSALACHAKGCGFKSCHSRLLKETRKKFLKGVTCWYSYKEYQQITEKVNRSVYQQRWVGMNVLRFTHTPEKGTRQNTSVTSEQARLRNISPEGKSSNIKL